MFSRLSLLVTAAPFLLVDALTLVTPSNVISGQPLTLRWDVAQGDNPSFSIFLHHPSFHSDFGVANNVGTSDLQITFTVPDVLPQDDYTFRATPINDATTTYSETNPFAISTVSSTVTQSSVPPKTSTTTTKTSTTQTTTNNTTTTTSQTNTQTTSSGFGVTVSNTNTQTTNTQTSTTGGSSPSDTPSSAISAVKFSFNGAGVGAFVLSVVAGASLLAF